jgi:transcriptional regulator with XRE-family HTH domain
MSATVLHFPDMAHLPNRLREWREARGLSQQELADEAGCSKMQISTLERGRPSLDIVWMQRLAPILRVEPGDLLNPDDNSKAARDAEELRLIMLARRMPPELREKFLGVGEALADWEGPSNTGQDGKDKAA